MAHVRLNRGYTSYFDPITRVHLTLANPESGVPDHYNLTGLRRAHEKGVIILVESKPEAQPGPGNVQEESVASVSNAQPAQELGQEEAKADAPGLQEAQAQNADAGDVGLSGEPEGNVSQEGKPSEGAPKKRERRKKS